MTKIIDISQHEFCKFATDFYSKPKAKEILHDMQQRLGLNPNLIMFCCWIAHTGQKQFTKQEMRHVITAILPWHEQIVLPLKKVHGILSVINNNLLMAKFGEIQAKANCSEQIMLAERMSKPCYKRSMLQKFNDGYKNINVYFKVMRLNVNEHEANLITKLLEMIFKDS